jgi:hypothetical protein
MATVALPGGMCAVLQVMASESPENAMSWLQSLCGSASQASQHVSISDTTQLALELRPECIYMPPSQRPPPCSLNLASALRQ